MTLNTHAWFAIPTVICVSFLVFFGMVSNLLLRFTAWNTKIVLYVKYSNQVISYAVILCANVAIFTGIVLYRTDPT
jgi:hypothetical protein